MGLIEDRSPALHITYDTYASALKETVQHDVATEEEPSEGLEGRAGEGDTTGGYSYVSLKVPLIKLVWNPKTIRRKPLP